MIKRVRTLILVKPFGITWGILCSCHWRERFKVGVVVSNACITDPSWQERVLCMHCAHTDSSLMIVYIIIARF